MFDHAGNKKRNIRMKCMLLIGLLVLLVLPAGAKQKQNMSVGVYTGWSFSLGDVFIDMTSGGHMFNHYKPNFILGAYLQQNFSESFSLQLSINYLNCSNHWKFYYWDRSEEGTDSTTNFSFNLNGIFNLSKSAMTQFYLLGGIGILVNSFQNLSSLMQLSGGIGVKLRVKPGSLTSFNLAAVVHHVIYYNYGEAQFADYLRLQTGLEFLFKDKRVL